MNNIKKQEKGVCQMNNIKKRLLSMLLTVAMLCGLCVPTAFAAESKYSDTEGHWAEGAIDRWSEYGIVQGNNGAFNPNGELTRAQMATVLANALGLTETAENPFSDIVGDEWYAADVLRCYAAGIMKGADGKASPNAPLSRQEAMVMLCRSLGIAPMENADFSAFRDGGSVSTWAAPYVGAMVKSGIVGGVGDSRLAPGVALTRASLMTILDRSVVQYINRAGTYELVDQDGLVLVAAGDVTLTGKTSANLLVTPAADGKALTFDKATVTGTVTVQADNAKVTNRDSKLPEITMTGEGSKVETSKPVISSGSSSGSNYTPPAGPSDLTVSAPGTVPGGTYRNVTIGSGVGDGEVTLENVIITGNLIVQGGGSNSIKLKGCTVSGKVIMAKESGEAPRLELTNTPNIKVEAQKPAIIEATDGSSSVATVEAKADVTVQGVQTKVATVSVPESASDVTLTVTNATVERVAAEAPITIAANANATPIQNVEVTDNLRLSGSTSVANVVIPKTATKKPEITVDSGAVAAKVEANKPAEVKGSGKVSNVEAKAAVEVASETVEKVTVTTAAAVTVSGTAEIEVAVETAAPTSIITTNSNVSVSTTQDTVNVVTKATEEDEGTQVTHVHKWGEGSVTKEPTCTKNGTKTYSCTIEGCDEEKSETLLATGHTELIDSAVAPTCTEAGKTAGKHCSVCNEVLVKQETIDALGHTEEVDAAVAATCTETGLTEGKHCSVCEEVIVAQKEIPAKGHTEAVIEAKAPTCTETGLTEGTKCSVCDTVLKAQEIVPVKEHTWNGSTCSVCGATKPGETPTTPEDANYVVNGAQPGNVVDRTFNEVTVSYSSNGEIRFTNCVFYGNVNVTYNAAVNQSALFDGCTFKNGAKIVVEGTKAPSDAYPISIILVQCTGAWITSDAAPVKIVTDSEADHGDDYYIKGPASFTSTYKLNGMTVTVKFDAADYYGGAHQIMDFKNPKKTEDYDICANRGYSMTISGEENATFRVGGKVDLGNLNVTSNQRIKLDAYGTGSELCTITLGNNKAQVVTGGTYFITAASENVEPVTIADTVTEGTVGVRVNNNWTQLPATSSISNLRFEMEKDRGYLCWDFMPGKDAENKAIHFEVYDGRGWSCDAVGDRALLTCPEGEYYNFTVCAFYWNNSKKVYIDTAWTSKDLKVVANAGTPSNTASATFTLPSTGNDYIEPEDYVVTISGLSGYQAYLMYVDSEYYNEHSKTFGIVTSGTETTAFPVSAVDYYDSTYTIYGIKDYQLANGVLSYTIDCLRTTTNVPKAASDVPAP